MSKRRPQRIDGGIDIRIDGHPDYVGEEADGPQLGQPFEARLAGHDIVHDDVETLLVELREASKVLEATSISR